MTGALPITVTSVSLAVVLHLDRERAHRLEHRAIRHGAREDEAGREEGEDQENRAGEKDHAADHKLVMRVYGVLAQRDEDRVLCIFGNASAVHQMAGQPAFIDGCAFEQGGKH